MESEKLREEGGKSAYVEPREGIGTDLAGKLCMGRDRMPVH